MPTQGLFDIHITNYMMSHHCHHEHLCYVRITTIINLSTMHIQDFKTVSIEIIS